MVLHRSTFLCVRNKTEIIVIEGSSKSESFCNLSSDEKTVKKKITVQVKIRGKTSKQMIKQQKEGR